MKIAEGSWGVSTKGYSPPSVGRIWVICGSYYYIPKAIFYLLKGDYIQPNSDIKVCDRSKVRERRELDNTWRSIGSDPYYSDPIQYWVTISFIFNSNTQQLTLVLQYGHKCHYPTCNTRCNVTTHEPPGSGVVSWASPAQTAESYVSLLR